MKRRIAILLAALMVIGTVSACKKGGNTGGGNATQAPGSATAGSSATATPPSDAQTAAPTEVPTATPEPMPTLDANLVDAALINFAGVDTEDCVQPHEDVTEVSIGRGDPFLTVFTSGATNDVQITIRFTDSGYADSVNTTDYPYLAFTYKLGYGSEVGRGNHLYALTGGQGPTPQDGMWWHYDFEHDGAWHTTVISFAEAFPALQGTLDGIWFPAASDQNGYMYLGYIGAFRSEEDAKTFADAFNTLYADKLVADQAPTDKEETTPANVVDAFTETTYDFTDYDFDVGSAFSDSTKIDGWTVGLGMRQSSFDNLDNPRLKIIFDSIAWNERLANGKAYSLSFDLQNLGTTRHFGGVVFNYSEKNSNNLNFFENNGMYDDGLGHTLTNKSGAGLNFIGKNTVMVFVMTYNDEANQLDVISYDFTIDEDMSRGYVRFTVSDDGKGTVKIYAGDKHLASITYADDKLLPPAASFYTERFYRSVKILGADGSEKASSEFGLMGYTKSFGFGGRAHDFFLDNITISNKEK